MSRLSFLHSFLFAAISPVILYLGIPTARVFVAPQAVFLPMLFALAINLLLLGIFYFLTGRNNHLTGLMATLFVLGLFYLWPLYFAILGAALVGLLFVKIIRKRVRSADMTLLLVTISVITSGYYLYQFTTFALAQPRRYEKKMVAPVPAGQETSVKPALARDIYYIILDGYGRQDMLRSIHGYDNSEFIAALQKRGFDVAGKSDANYPRTLLSLASSLNMQYLDRLSTEMGDSYFWWPAMDTIHHSLVRSFLEQHGYRTVFVSSGWDFTDIQDGNVYLSAYPVMLSDFSKAYLEATNLRILAGIERFGVSYPSYDAYRHIILFNFDAVSEAAKLPGPKFVFAHILSPHPPYVFDSHGNPIEQSSPLALFGSNRGVGNLSQFRQAYLDQLSFINQKTLTMVDGILANSKIPPVIIIQADHGPDIFMDFGNADRACLYERYSILNAYYLPGVDASIVPTDISPVNSFRMVFNLYFGTSLAWLPDLSYYSGDMSLYQFQDITARMGTPCNLPADAQP